MGGTCVAFSLSIKRIREEKKWFDNRCNSAADCQKKTPDDDEQRKRRRRTKKEKKKNIVALLGREEFIHETTLVS